MTTFAFIYRGDNTLKFNSTKTDIKNYLGLLFILISYLFSHYLKYPEFPIWLDEYTQFHNSTRPLIKSLIDSAFYEQQPPLDYVLTGFSTFLFGETEFALKFHTLLFGLLFFLHLPAFFKDLGIEKKLSYTATLILIWSPPLLGYSLEARPIMLCLFWGLIFTFSLRKFLKQPNKENFIYLTLSQFILVLTTSLQPEIFILTAFICTLLFLKKESNLIMKVFYTNFITLLYALPTLYYVTILADKTNQIADSSYHNFLLFFNFYNAGEVLKMITCSPYISGTFSLVICLRFTLWRKKKPSRDFLYYSSFTILFYLIYLLSYYSFISWHFAFRYALLFYIPFIASSLLAIQEIKEILPKFFRNLFLSIILAIGIVGAYKSALIPIDSRISALSRTDWRSLYSFLNKDIEDEDLVVRFNFDTILEWRGGSWVASRIYLNDQHKTKLLSTHDFFPENSNSVFIDKEFNYLNKTQGKIYIINEIQRMHPNWYKTRPIQGLTKVYKSPLLEVFTLPIRVNLFETLREYLLQVIEKLGQDQEATVAAWESLIVLEFIYGEKEKFQTYLNLYKQIKPENHWTRDGIIIDKNKILLERARFLETVALDFKINQKRYRANLGF